MNNLTLSVRLYWLLVRNKVESLKDLTVDFKNRIYHNSNLFHPVGFGFKSKKELLTVLKQIK